MPIYYREQVIRVDKASVDFALIIVLVFCCAMVLVNNKDRTMRHPRGFTSRRRAYLAKKVDQLDRLEVRNTITEPISVLGLSLSSLRGLVQLGIMHPNGGSNIPSGLKRPDQEAGQGRPQAIHKMAAASDFSPMEIGWQADDSAGAATGGGGSANDAPASATTIPSQSGDWLSINSPANSDTTETGITAPWHPAKRAGGGGALPPRGGSGGPSATKPGTRGAITPLSLPASTPAATNGGASAALLAAAAGAGAGNGGSAAAGSGSLPGIAQAVTADHNSPSGAAPVQTTRGRNPSPADSQSGGSSLPGSTPDPIIGNFSPPSQGSFPYFPVYVLDYNNGVVLFPGADQVGIMGTKVDLEAQVTGTTVSSYSWGTSGLTDVTNMSATNTYQLTFNWSGTVSTAKSVPLTLSVTDINSHTETYTYDFWLPLGSVNSSGGTDATWPTSLAPDQELLSSPAFNSDDASVDATSGALDTQINLPSYNPNVPAIGLTYDSLTANPLPIIVVENTLSAAAAVPSKVSAQLTFNSGGGTAWYYNTSQLNPGDVQQIALQANATSLATGRYSYSVQVVDYGTTNTTTTLSGSASVINESTSALGDGWQLQGLEQITSATGGVILNLGEQGRSLWFSGSVGSGGGTYTDPQGEFSTLVKNSGGSYTDTLTDGTQVTFNSGGYETATIDLNGLHTTYAYNGSNAISTITDPYNNITTFSYSGGYLQSIKDPAGRLTTFTVSGGALTGVQQTDGSHITYTYDSGGRLTQITDPLSHTATIGYDSAERVSTITRPDGSTEIFTNDQESGWTNSGTSGSPAPATLLAQATSTYTDPNSNVTTLRSDWWGMGATNVQIDALGNVVTYDLNSNGLATAVIDQVNRASTFTFDSKGNMTGESYPDANKIGYTWNSDAEPLTFTNEDNNTSNYTYDSHGNLTVVEDPLGNLTTMTYTSTGRVQTSTDANKHTTTYLYDSQDRVTTVVNPDGTTVLTAYNSQSNAIKVTDERGDATTYSFDALNRETGMSEPLSVVATYVYDSGGNLTVDQEPTPTGQTARTTTYAYDSMNRLTTVTAPLSLVTVYGYDADGNRVSVKDPMGRITTTIFDALDRPIVNVDSMNNSTTATYDGDGEIIQVVDPMGRITTTAFDNRGWVATVTDPLGNTITYSYTATGQASTVTNPGSGGGQSYVYDLDDRLVASTDPNGNTTSFGYDAVGNEITVTDANNHVVTYAYDSMNRQTTVTDSMGDTTVYGYDSGGNQITVTDGLGHTATTLYDALNRATTMISAVVGTTTIAYDVAGREISLTDPVGNETQWAYNADDRVTTLTQANGATVTYVYDNDGELTDTTDADGRRTTYSYNADGDQTGETWVGASPAEKITYTYDADDELTGAADAYAILTFTYDSGGNQLTAATSGSGTGQPSVTLTSAYNAQHSRASLTDNLSSAGITTYAYDAGQRLTTITTSYGGTAGPQVVTSYDPANRITAQSRTIGGTGTAVATSFSYDAANRQTTITDQVTGGSALATYVYSYDKANRVTTQVNADGTYTYTYDNADELTGVDKNGSQVESYSYDLNGNRTGTGYSTTIMNETATSPGITYTYDNAGNMISANNGTSITTYTYDYRDRLTKVTQGGTVVASYAYDALNNRIGINDNGAQTWTVYDGTNPYADFNSSGTLQERYLFGPGVINGAAVDELLARTSSGGTTAWYLTDKLGSVRDIVSTSGLELDHVVYDSFGNIVTETDAANGDRFKYAGMEYDSVTGQLYDRARYYNSAAGRFSSQDSMGFNAGDANLYRYVGNSPLNSTDPTGMQQGDQRVTNIYNRANQLQEGLDQELEDRLQSQQLIIRKNKYVLLSLQEGLAQAKANAIAERGLYQQMVLNGQAENEIQGQAQIVQNAMSIIKMRQALVDQVASRLEGARQQAAAIYAQWREKSMAFLNDAISGIRQAEEQSSFIELESYDSSQDPQPRPQPPQPPPPPPVFPPGQPPG